MAKPSYHQGLVIVRASIQPHAPIVGPLHPCIWAALDNASKHLFQKRSMCQRESSLHSPLTASVCCFTVDVRLPVPQRCIQLEYNRIQVPLIPAQFQQQKETPCDLY